MAPTTGYHAAFGNGCSRIVPPDTIGNVFGLTTLDGVKVWTGAVKIRP